MLPKPARNLGSETESMECVETGLGDAHPQSVAQSTDPKRKLNILFSILSCPIGRWPVRRDLD